jgi:tRNA-splicing ligase RtcB (3'-phosphate/5'-hydroxy nucleic acid ligase)
MNVSLEKIDDYRWRVPRRGDMRTDGIIYASEQMVRKITDEKAAEQVANVACLPGIAGAALAMPDIHWGYGFPIGGVAATDAADGVISPGGIGYDISCGVRLLRSNLVVKDLEGKTDRLADALFQAVPSGVGSTGRLRLNPQEVRKVFVKGSKWSVERGLGDAEDLETCEDGGFLDTADPDLPSERAVERGRDQLGTLGSGNHFLEVQRVEGLFDPAAAEAFGLFPGQVTVMIHTGSRGCGYQICEDHLASMQHAARKYNIALPDRQLSCAPVSSQEGREYFAAMSAGANYARANRQAITHWVREAFLQVFGVSPRDLGMGVVYDVCHNIGKMEEHVVDGRKRRLCVHRKGATRAFPAAHPEVPERYRDVGQPVLIPGTMGTASYVAVGTDRAMKETFGTTCHGAGRVMSRKQASKQIGGRELQDELKEKGVLVRSASLKGLAEEAPMAYKDVDDVVNVCEGAGLVRKTARLRPLAVVKG